MKIFKVSLLVVFLTSLFIIPASATEEDKFPLFDLRAGQWFSKANSSWNISFPSGGGKGESELKYDDTDSNVLMLEARVRPSTEFSVGINGGFGGISGSKYTDIDRTDGWVWSESQGPVDGKVKQWGFNLYWHVLPESSDNSGWMSVFSGYQHYEDNLRMFNGHQTIPYNKPIDRLNSTYNFKWDYLQVGTEGGYSLISTPRPGLHDISATGSLALIPLVNYEGEGVWNLRTDFKKDPSFKHESTSGWGVDVNAALNYKPHELVTFIVGYRYLYLQAHKGTDTTYFSNGGRGSSDLDNVRLDRHGPFVSLSVQF